MVPERVDVFPLENGDIPASYVGLPEGNKKVVYGNKMVGTRGYQRPCYLHTTNPNHQFYVTWSYNPKQPVYFMDVWWFPTIF